jgi:acetyl esterase/lipase
MRSSFAYGLLPMALAAQASLALAQSAPDIPFSDLASPEARQAWNNRNEFSEEFAKWKASHTTSTNDTPSSLYARFLRDWGDKQFVPRLLAKQESRYQVKVATRIIDGIYTESITPAAGVSTENRERVLINLHGGGFLAGARGGGRVESIPIASVGRIRVVSVDYRMAPEHVFPAASEDVATVYRALLKTYRPENIGIYGCSAGGQLTAEAVAWFIENNLPVPGAIAMLCGTGDEMSRGDSITFWSALNGLPYIARGTSSIELDYFKNADPNSALVFPMRHPEVLRKFPPSLFVTGTRAVEMSSMIDANNKLALAGVETQLHIWDGVTHGFLNDPDLPESRQAYDIITKFFDSHLGRPR